MTTYFDDRIKVLRLNYFAGCVQSILDPSPRPRGMFLRHGAKISTAQQHNTVISPMEKQARAVFRPANDTKVPANI